MFRVHEITQFWRRVGFRWVGARCWERGAAMAFFAMFSLAPLFVLLLSLLDRLFGAVVARGEAYQSVVRVLGPESAEAVRALLLQPSLFEGSTGTILVNVVLTAFGATALFRHMQNSLAILWAREEAEYRPIRRLVRGFLRSFFAMGSLVVIAVGGFLFLAMAVLAGPILKQLVFGSALPGLWSLVSNWFFIVGALGIFAVLYSALAPESPSAKRLWTALSVLAVGLLGAKIVIHPIAQSKSLFSLFGAGSAVVYLLLWCFILSQLFLFGASVAAVHTEQEG